MNKTSLIHVGKVLCCGLFAALTLTATLPLTGCGGGGSSNSSGQNVTNAPAPASLPAGLILTTPSGKLTVIDGSHFRFVENNGAVTDGTFTYSTSGTTATLTITPNGGASQASQATSFTVTNGNYASTVMTPAGETSYTATFGGTTVPYVAPASPSNPSATNGTPVVGSVYVVTARSGNDPDAGAIGTTIKITAITDTTLTAEVTNPGEAPGPETLTRQSDGSYKQVSTGANPWTTVITFTSNASGGTIVSTGSGADAGLFENYTFSKQ